MEDVSFGKFLFGSFWFECKQQNMIPPWKSTQVKRIGPALNHSFKGEYNTTKKWSHKNGQVSQKQTVLENDNNIYMENS